MQQDANNDQSSSNSNSASVDSKARQRLNPALLSLLCITILVVAIYLYGVVYFSSHFGLNTTVDQRNMTYLTVAEAEARLSQNADRYVLTITGREGLLQTIEASDVDLRYVPDGQMTVLLESQNPWLWFTRVLPQRSITTQPSCSFESNLLTRYLNKTEAFSEENMRSPVDARAVFELDHYVIIEQDLGTTLRIDAVYSALATSISTQKADCDLDRAGCYLTPRVYSDDADLIALMNDYNTYVPFEIIYDFGSFTETLDANVAYAWFDSNPDGSKSLNYAALDSWLDGFCLRHNTLGVERTFVSARGESMSVSGGSYGWWINRSEERAAIIAALNSKTSVTREPYYNTRAVEHTGEAGTPDWGGTYIEIDQGVQKIYLFKDGVLVFEADVVTGLPTPRWCTPVGVYYVRNKLSPARLVGPIQEDGNPMWDSRVSFWMGVTAGGVGIHDAYWQPWFGGTRYQYGGSHGCINMSYNNARTLYNMVDVGTPVIIHW
jgi:lipoprotein-anchoring transpeptidase ErfK/SrfK